MKYILTFFAFLCCIQTVHSKPLRNKTIRNNTLWGKTGHRVVGQVASFYLDKKAKKAVHRILKGQSMAIVAPWMDFIKSNPKWDYTKSWHYVNIPKGETYAQSKKNPKGDIIQALKRIIKELKKGDLSLKKERIDLKMLIHFVGDIHQPLHAGYGKDRGGNEITVLWFGKPTNLHRVWDSGMINSSLLSYTELANAINHVSKQQVKKWQNSTVLDWVRGSRKLLPKVYDLPKNHHLGYDYMYKNWPVVKKQLLKAGIRLAGVLNEIYG
jgi:hypothetical protein